MSVGVIRNKLSLKEDINQDTNKREQFANPISKTTFQALPRIYGSRKKKKYALRYQFKPKEKHQQEGSNRECGPYFCHTSHTKCLPESKIEPDNNANNDNSTRRLKTEMRSYDKKYTEQLSLPKRQFCRKRYCFCNKQHDQRLGKSQSKNKIKNRPSKLLSLKLPELQRQSEPRYEPEDIETKHKVAMNNNNRTETGPVEINRLTLLDFLRNSQGQPTHNSNRIKTPAFTDKEDQKQEKKSVEMQYPEPDPPNTVSIQTEFEEEEPKGKTSTLDNYLPKNRQRKVVSNASARPLSKHQKPEEESQLNEENPHFKLQKLRAQFKEIVQLDSEQDDAKSVVSSISSASLSKHVFDSDKKVNTMFHTLKNKGSSSVKSSKINQSQHSDQKVRSQTDKKKAVFQKQNGLFVIPEEDEFVEYLKNYKPINQNFTIKKLVRKENFTVVPSNEGVYFGQFVDDKRSGKGLMVTQREVFEGQYANDQKTYGCDRNIDGVYKGEFANGIRQGYGTFEWYNGEVFEGQWKNGTKNGFGIWKSPKGDFYEGNWLLNRQHGKGIYKHRLSTYRGEFSQFLKQGHGEEIFSNGDKYVGSYRQGKPHGKGKYEWADGSFYEGYFESGVRQGRGKWVFSNGTIYEGEFKNDYKQGYGVEQYKTGQRFEGTFKEGERQEGTLYDQNRNGTKISHNQ